MDVVLIGLQHWLSFKPAWYTPAIAIVFTGLVILHYYVFAYGLTALVK